MTFIVTLGFLFASAFNYAQEQTQNRVRIKADYFKVMDEGSRIELSTNARIDRKTVAVPGIELEIFSTTEEEEKALGSVIMDAEGKGVLDLGTINNHSSDSSAYYNFSISFKGNKAYKKANKTISVMDAEITARHIVRDSVNYIEATLKDIAKDSTIEGTSIDVQVRRLFMPLKLGEEFNSTDDSGTVLVPIEEGIPGIDGNLILEAVLSDNDDYGNVMAWIEAPVGVPIIEDSSFDERALWGPTNRTPVFILIFTYGLILGILGIVIYLVLNLIRIKKAQ